ncbi:MAG: hypothetical protein V1690_03930 [Candidatus Moraniibacteriota bacterium]
MMYDFSQVLSRSGADEEIKKDIPAKTENPEFRSIFILKGKEIKMESTVGIPVL